MVTQLERPSRIERGGDSNPINRIKDVKNTVQNITKKPVTLNFICMILVAIAFDAVGFFASPVPGAGAFISFTAGVVFIPWFYFSGIRFNLKKISSMGGTSLLEFFPFTGSLPWITINVIYSYYSE